jgi:RND family efflux transporter MFP subunit
MRSSASFAVVLLASLLFGSGLGHAEGAPAAPEVVAPTVTVVSAEMRELVGEIVVTGTLAAREEVMVGPEIDGSRIVEILVDEGDLVAKGQVLARLSRELLDAELAAIEAALARARTNVDVVHSQIDEAAATVAQAEADFERTRQLAKRGNASAATLDEREAAAKTARARLATARQNVRVAEAQVVEVEADRAEVMVKIGFTEIKAPASGKVSERVARLGALAAMTGEPLFRIVEDNEIELHAQVAEVQLARLKVGQPVAAFPVGREDAIEGEVRLVAAQIDRQSRLGKVKVRLRESDGLTLGTFARGRIEIDRQRGVVVPISAIQFVADRQEVQVVNNDQVETRVVELGLRTNDAAIVLAGLEAGEKIVALSGTFLRDGDRVRPVDVQSMEPPLTDAPQLSSRS